MKKESHGTLDIGIQQQGTFIASKDDIKEQNKNNNVFKESAVKIDKKVDNGIKVNNNDGNVNDNNNNNNNNNNDNDNIISQPIDTKGSEVKSMEISNGTEIQPVTTNGNSQNCIDSSIRNNNNNNNNDNNDNFNESCNDKNNKGFDDDMDKELLCKISETLAEFYGGGSKVDEIGEPQKKRPRSCAKEYSIISIEGENQFPEIKIRDFAFSTDDPRHWGQRIPSSSDGEEEDDEYTNRRARALYDFVAENQNELSFQEGDILLIQYRQCEGWLFAELDEKTGLIPDNYILLLDDDIEEDEYGNWAEEGDNNE